MRRVITKCRLASKDAFEKKLSDINLDFSGIHWQHDRIYVPREYKSNSSFPRLIMRTDMRAVDRPATYSLILKRHIEESGADIVEEIKTEEYEKMVNVILQLGFKPLAEVSRRRQYLGMSEGVTVCLDEVDGLPGCYAKIEANLGPDDSIADARNDLMSTFRALGEANFITTPYFEMKNS